MKSMIVIALLGLSFASCNNDTTPKYNSDVDYRVSYVKPETDTATLSAILDPKSTGFDTSEYKSLLKLLRTHKNYNEETKAAVGEEYQALTQFSSVDESIQVIKNMLNNFPKANATFYNEFVTTAAKMSGHDITLKKYGEASSNTVEFPVN